MYSAPIIRRALEIVTLIVREHEQLGVTEIARVLSMNKSTAFGILKALEEAGYVIKDQATKKYGLGQGLFDLSRMIFRRTDLVTLARPILQELVDLVDETVFLGLREDDRVKIVDVAEAKKELKISSSVGTRLPLTAAATGKVFFSLMHDDEIRDYLKERGLHRFTEASITDIELFLKEIERTRRLGYGVDLEEYLRGIRAVATLIRSGSYPLCALWIVGFSSSMNDEKLSTIVPHLIRSAQAIETRIQSKGLPVYFDEESLNSFLENQAKAVVNQVQSPKADETLKKR